MDPLLPLFVIFTLLLLLVHIPAAGPNHVSTLITGLLSSSPLYRVLNSSNSQRNAPWKHNRASTHRSEWNFVTSSPFSSSSTFKLAMNHRNNHLRRSVNPMPNIFVDMLKGKKQQLFGEDNHSNIAAGHSGNAGNKHFGNGEVEVVEPPCPAADTNPLLVIVGATSTGKSDLAIAIARALGNGGEVINADSMQIYQGLDVATNKVSTENMGGVPHHLMSFLKPTDSDYSRWHFRNDAIRTIEGVWKRGGLPIVAGGSSWINVLLHCMTMPKREKSPIPGIDRELLLDRFSTREALYNELKRVDPETAANLIPEQTARIIEELTSYYSFHMKTASQLEREEKIMLKESAQEHTYIPLRYKNTFVLYLDVEDRDAHEFGLAKRVNRMMDVGLIEELEDFYETHNNKIGHFGAMQTIGLIAFLPYLGLSRDEKASGLGHRVLDECKRTFQRGDSNYAEKQRHNFYQLLNQNPSKETPNFVVLNMSNDFHKEVVPFAVNLVNHFVSGYSVEELLKKYPSLHMGLEDC